MIRIILSCLTISIAGGCYQYIESPCSHFRKINNSTDCLKYLKSSRCFRIGGVGYVGVTPPEEICLRRLMNQNEANESLMKLFNEGSLAGKLYALLGLRYINKTVSHKLAAGLRDCDDKIESQGGCIVFQASVCDLVKSIENGDFDIYMEREL